jgi:hypothetical protein
VEVVFCGTRFRAKSRVVERALLKALGVVGVGVDGAGDGERVCGLDGKGLRVGLRVDGLVT